MGLNLYQIVLELEQLSEKWVDYETGEINEDIEAQMDELKLTLDQKLSNIWSLLKNWDSEISALSGEIKKLTARKKALSNAFDRLKQYAASALEPGKAWKSKEENSVAAFGWRKSTSCDVFAENLVGDDYIEIVRKPNVAMIKDALKKGQAIPGAKLIDKMNLTIK